MEKEKKYHQKILLKRKIMTSRVKKEALDNQSLKFLKYDGKIQIQVRLKKTQEI